MLHTVVVVIGGIVVVLIIVFHPFAHVPQIMDSVFDYTILVFHIWITIIRIRHILNINRCVCDYGGNNMLNCWIFYLKIIQHIVSTNPKFHKRSKKINNWLKWTHCKRWTCWSSLMIMMNNSRKIVVQCLIPTTYTSQKHH
jgi:hypothetical protein